MGSTINELIRQRKSVYRDLKRAMRIVDTYQEAAQRTINRVLARRRSIPDNNDYIELVGKCRETESAHNELLKLLEQYAGVFTI